jgi:predicted ATPase
MNLDLKNIQIKNFLGEWNIDWNLKKVNVLVGKNGSGKTKLLQLIQNLIENEELDALFNEAKITFCNGIEINSYIVEDKNSDISKEMKSIMLMNFDKIKEEISNTLSKDKSKNKTEEISTLFLEMIERKFNESQEISVGKNSLIKNKSFTRAYNTKTPASIKGDLDISKELNVTYLSTVNMNANALNIVNKSNGKISTILDMEIADEITKLNNSKNKEKTINLFIKTINSFFIDTNKKIEFSENTLLIKKDENEALDLMSLSSGERQLIFIFLKIVNSLTKRTLILMDEPEISLHLKWQEKLIKAILDINKDNQIIIVTHSPAMIMNGWLDSYTDINNIRTEV